MDWTSVGLLAFKTSKQPSSGTPRAYSMVPMAPSQSSGPSASRDRNGLIAISPPAPAGGGGRESAAPPGRRPGRPFRPRGGPAGSRARGRDRGRRPLPWACPRAWDASRTAAPARRAPRTRSRARPPSPSPSAPPFSVAPAPREGRGPGPRRPRVERLELAREPDHRPHRLQRLHAPLPAGEPAAGRDHVAALESEQIEEGGFG